MKLPKNFHLASPQNSRTADTESSLQWGFWWPMQTNLLFSLQQWYSSFQVCKPDLMCVVSLWAESHAGLAYWPKPICWIQLQTGAIQCTGPHHLTPGAAHRFGNLAARKQRLARLPVPQHQILWLTGQMALPHRFALLHRPEVEHHCPTAQVYSLSLPVPSDHIRRLWKWRGLVLHWLPLPEVHASCYSFGLLPFSTHFAKKSVSSKEQSNGFLWTTDHPCPSAKAQSFSDASVATNPLFLIYQDPEKVTSPRSVEWHQLIGC